MGVKGEQITDEQLLILNKDRILSGLKKEVRYEYGRGLMTKKKNQNNFSKEKWDKFVLDISDFIDDLNTLDFLTEKTYLKYQLSVGLGKVVSKYFTKNATDKLYGRGKYKDKRNYDEKESDAKYSQAIDLTNENRVDVVKTIKEKKTTTSKQTDLIDYITMLEFQELADDC